MSSACMHTHKSDGALTCWPGRNGDLDNNREKHWGPTVDSWDLVSTCQCAISFLQIPNGLGIAHGSACFTGYQMLMTETAGMCTFWKVLPQQNNSRCAQTWNLPVKCFYFGALLVLFPALFLVLLFTSWAVCDTAGANLISSNISGQASQVPVSFKAFSPWFPVGLSVWVGFPKFIQRLLFVDL